MDYLLPILGLLIIITLIVGATIGINTLMTRKIHFLSLKNILLIIASIVSTFLIIILPIHYFDGTLTWGLFFSILLTIPILFLLAHSAPKLPIVSHFQEIHQSNLDDCKE